jgi:hypothetical protein
VAASPSVIAQLVPLVTVTPSTDLVNLQTVTIAGSGFSPNANIGGALCKAGTDGADNCDTAHPVLTTADATGAFSVQFQVRRILHTANGDVDCASALQTCHLGIANIADQEGQHAFVPLSYDPNAPLPPKPSLLVAPTTGLVEGQELAVFGGGFVPNDPVVFRQCAAPGSIASPCAFLGSAIADAEGNVLALVAVHRTIVQPPVFSVDCAAAPGTCSFVAASINDVDVINQVPLSFDPNGPLPSAQVVVTPATDLVDHQTVLLSGSGWPADVSPEFGQCKTGAKDFGECRNTIVGYGPPNADGTFAFPFAVRRILHLGNGDDFDCGSAPGACSIVSFTFDGSPVLVTSPISFDPNVAPPPPPTITVTPSTDLVQGQKVSVTGTGFAPNSFVRVSQCLTSEDEDGFCPSFGAFARTDANGAFVSEYAVARGVRTFDGDNPVVDCASGPGVCSLAAFADDDRASQVLDFDPNAPLRPATVTVTPDTDLPDRALVTVHGEGFTPGDQIAVSQCSADTPVFVFGCSNLSQSESVIVGDDGTFDRRMRVHREIEDFSGPGPVNCASAFGACVVHVESLQDPIQSRSVPLGFDPHAVAPPPTLTIIPAGPYADGQQVVVEGAGFAPFASLGLAECVADVEPNARTCDTTSHTGDEHEPGGLFERFSADADGAFTRTVTLHSTFVSDTGPVNCLVQANGCVLFAANREDFGAERASVPISFATGASGAERVETIRALAFTGAGSSTRGLAAVGAIVLGLGLVVVAVSRRRRTAS